MLPTMGQGACTALEDADVVAKCFKENFSYSGSLVRANCSSIGSITEKLGLKPRRSGRLFIVLPSHHILSK
jgi:hypothetical protein